VCRKAIRSGIGTSGGGVGGSSPVVPSDFPVLIGSGAQP